MGARRYGRMALLFGLGFLSCGSRSAPAFDLTGTAWAEAAAPHRLDPALLYAVALMESGRPRDGGLAPWPWTLWLPLWQALQRLLRLVLMPVTATAWVIEAGKITPANQAVQENEVPAAQKISLPWL